MSDKLFHLEVITPERSAVDADVQSVQVTATDGLTGVLARHAPLIAAIAVGPLKYKDESGKETTLLVGDGFCEVLNNRMKVLGDFAEFPDEIDADRATSALERAKDRLAHRKDPEIDAERAEGALRRAMARLRMSGRGI
jgi:F-type H+-transporting ATPase subunit epsilon